ncbi:uncharacterized protein LOC132702833 [Cylas formicarius]|uniref:uncharacterized protein LOC132702833 n=1 Tax=Cylas formicarius TaxID=197179 RepID=UPI0029586A54|nr:uncharacterized protein LOC132702833 [Cylas formicarius]
MRLIKFIFFTIFCHKSLGQYRDPHEMISGAKEKLNGHQMDEYFSKSAKKPTILDNSMFYVHLKRIISRIVNSAHFDKSDPDIYIGHLVFDITPIDLKFLTDFREAEVTLDTLRKLDTIISESFSKTFVDEYLQAFTELQVQLYSAVINVQNLWLIGSCFLIYAVYQLFKTNFSLAYIIKYLIIVVFVIDFVLRYQVLLEQAEEHNLNIQYSAMCDTSKMSWRDYFVFLTSSQDCERKTVTPLDAFLYQIRNVIVIPLHAFGSGIGGFGAQLYKNTPWGIGLLFFPVLLIFTLLLLVFGMALVMDRTIEFNFFHLIKLKFGGGGAGNAALTGRMAEKLLDRLFHRPMVQDIKVNASNSHHDNQLQNNDQDVKYLEGPTAEPREEDGDNLALASTNCKKEISANKKSVATKKTATGDISNTNVDIETMANRTVDIVDLK